MHYDDIQGKLNAQSQAISGAIRPPTFYDRLSSERDRLRERLRDVEDALAMMERDNNLRQTLDAISRLGHF